MGNVGETFTNVQSRTKVCPCEVWKAVDTDPKSEYNPLLEAETGRTLFHPASPVLPQAKLLAIFSILKVTLVSAAGPELSSNCYAGFELASGGEGSDKMHNGTHFHKIVWQKDVNSWIQISICDILKSTIIASLDQAKVHLVQHSNLSLLNALKVKKARTWEPVFVAWEQYLCHWFCLWNLPQKPRVWSASWLLPLPIEKCMCHNYMDCMGRVFSPFWV